MRRTRSGEETQHARSPFRGGSGNNPPGVSGAVLFTDPFSAVTFVKTRHGDTVQWFRTDGRSGTALGTSAISTTRSQQRTA